MNTIQVNQKAYFQLLASTKIRASVSDHTILIYKEMPFLSPKD